MATPTTRTRRLVALAAVLAASIALAGCSGEGESEANADSTFTIGTQPWLGYGPWYIAQDQGFDDDHGITVELTNFSTDAEVTAALAGGKLDAANVATHTALKLIEAGVEISIVLVQDVSTTADAIAAIGLTQVSELEGQKVAYEEGTTSDILLQSALAKEGMTIDDITKVPLPASDAGGALLAGRTQVAVTYEPYLSEALKAGNGVELIYTAAEDPGIISDVLVVRNDLIEEAPDTVQAVVDTWMDSVAYYQSDTESGQEIISTGVGSKREDLISAFDGVEFYGADENREQLTGDFADTVLPMVKEAAVHAGVLTGELEVDNVIDASFVEGSGSE